VVTDEQRAGTTYEELCARRAAGSLRDLAREVAALLRDLHSWPVPADVAEMLRRPGEDPDPLRRAGAVLALPPMAALGLIPLAGQLPFVDRGVLSAAAERLTELASLITPGGEVLLHGDFYLGNVLVHDSHVSALIDFEFARLGPPDLDKRLWLYALAYTIRHIIFWPPDRPEAAGLDVSHPLHTLRRLMDAPLPL
jgi:hygromycin-B 7''-O-kinase